MKRIIVIMLVFLFLCKGNELFAQKDRILSKGFSMSFVLGFIPDDYTFIKDIPNRENSTSLLFGLKYGNRWYTKLNDNFALGAMVNWLGINVSVGKTKTGRSISDTTYFSTNSDFILDISFFETGPILTYAFNKKIGIDIYYNVRPGAIGFKTLGISHAVGIGIRWKVLMLNVEYIFGKYPSGEYFNSKPKNTVINHTRIALGFKL